LRPEGPLAEQPEDKDKETVMSLQIMLIIHLAIASFLIAIILLQQGKGADVGATFGGGGGTIFGAAGADNLLTRVTAIAAFGFMTTSIVLAMMQKPSNNAVGGSLFNSLPDKAPMVAPEVDAANSAPAPASSSNAPADAASNASSQSTSVTGTAPSEAAASEANAATSVAPETKSVETKAIGSSATGASEPTVLKLEPTAGEAIKVTPSDTPLTNPVANAAGTATSTIEKSIEKVVVDTKAAADKAVSDAAAKVKNKITP